MMFHFVSFHILSLFVAFVIARDGVASKHENRVNYVFGMKQMSLHEMMKDFDFLKMKNEKSANDMKIISKNKGTPNLKKGGQRQLQTDEEVCHQILDLTYKSDYEKLMNACQCSRDEDDTSSFSSKCNYNYCESCMPSTELCGYMVGETTYSGDSTDASLIVPTKTLACLQYTAGIDTNICLDTSFDWTTLAMTCSIGINDMSQKCNSCELTQCDPSNENSEYVFSFDCSNIDGGYSLNQCDYQQFTSTPLPVAEPLDPFVFLRFTLHSDSWNRCYDPTPANDSTNIPTTPELLTPTLSPIENVSDPTTAAPAFPNTPLPATVKTPGSGAPIPSMSPPITTASPHATPIASKPAESPTNLSPPSSESSASAYSYISTVAFSSFAAMMIILA